MTHGNSELVLVECRKIQPRVQVGFRQVHSAGKLDPSRKNPSATMSPRPESPECVPGPLTIPPSSQRPFSGAIEVSWLWRRPPTYPRFWASEPSLFNTANSGCAASDMLAPDGFCCATGEMKNSWHIDSRASLLDLSNEQRLHNTRTFGTVRGLSPDVHLSVAAAGSLCISLISIACPPLRSKTFPLAWTSSPTNGFN
jgi:hypothetical protein